MGNLTNKDLQRMRELMGNRKPINESKLVSAVELIKKSPDGKFYGVVRENKKYFIKESTDGSNFDFIGGVANKNKHQFESYEHAVRILNLMLEDTDVLTPDLIEEKKFVIKTKKKSEPATDFDFGGGEGGGNETPDFDFGGDAEGGDTPDFDFGGGDEGGDSEEVDFGGGDDLDLEGGDDELSDEDDPIKSIQKMTGKLGQKIRDTEDISSDMSKWVAKSVLSALDLDGMDNEDKKDLIRTIKNDEAEGSDEEIDFMDDDDCVNCDGSGYDENYEECVNCGGTGEVESDDMVDWNSMSPEEKSEFVQASFPGDSEKPMMDWDEDAQIGKYDDLVSQDEPYRRTGESQYMLFDPEEVDVDYMDDEEELYGPGDETIEQGEELLNDELPYYEDENRQEYFGDEDWMSDEDETYPYYEKNTDYMSKFAGDVKRGLSSGSRNLEMHELDTHLRKIKAKLGGRTTHIDNNMVVGSFGFVKVTNNGYELHREGERFPRTFRFDELGKLKNALSGVDYMDYMEDDVRNPAPAPTKPSTKPDVKPGKPGTDKPSPSKRPFTPPPHITPGEEPAPKAKDKWSRTKPYDEKYVDYNYEYPEGEYDYMDDDDSCPTCQGRGHMRQPIGFNRGSIPQCTECGGSGKRFVGNQPNISSEDEITEPYVNNPFGYESNSTLPNGLDYTIDYKEKFSFPFPVGNIDYMDDFDDTLPSNKKRFRPMNPAPAPTKPSTKPDVKPGKPGTDKPSPSKRPFTPPPHITPGEEPAPKARNRRF